MNKMNKQKEKEEKSRVACVRSGDFFSFFLLFSLSDFN